MLIPDVLFSQILDQNDIVIWVENSEKFWDVLEENLDSEDNDWKNYLELEIILQPASVSNYDADSYIDYFHAFLDCKVPGELEDFFRSIGWGVDGHKKYFSIIFGFYFLTFKQSPEYLEEDNFNDIVNEMLLLFNEDDLEIIENNGAGIIDLLRF
jgi:hypothetical protein